MLKKIRQKRGIVVGYLLIIPAVVVLAGHVGYKAGLLGEGGQWATNETNEAKIRRLTQHVQK